MASNMKVNKLAKRILPVIAVSVMVTALSGCNFVSRLSEVGDGPKLTSIQNPQSAPDYQPVSLPMPAPEVAHENPSSLWRNGARAFFKDTRAKEIGDMVTVQLNLADTASLTNNTARDRTDSENASVTALLGYQSQLDQVFPDAVDPTAIASFGNRHSTDGDGEISRSETINLTFAAVVTQILPNGSLVIMGRQEILVNYEMRELMVTGVVRPEDIENGNVVSHEKIAEMRVAYGGRGTLSQLQQPRWGTQIWDIIFPF